MTRAAALDYAKYGITVNAICPGYTKTSIFGDAPQQAMDFFASDCPAGRMGSPEECAALMLFSTGYGTLLRAEGAIKDGFIGNMGGTVTNIVLDPLLIMVFKLGVAGAAVATVIGNLVATVFYLRFVFRKAAVLNLIPANALRRPQALFSVLALGLPNAISSVLSGTAAAGFSWDGTRFCTSSPAMCHVYLTPSVFGGIIIE